MPGPIHDWTAHQVIEFYTDSKNGLGLPAVCDDKEAIEKAFLARRAVKLRDEKSPTPGTAYAAREWMKHADHLIRHRTQLLQLVYDLFESLADIAISTGGDGNRGIYTPQLEQRLLKLAHTQCKANESLGRRFLEHYRKTRYGRLQVEVGAPRAEVTVNGVPMGEAGSGKPLQCEGLPAGEVSVSVAADGYEPQSKTVQIAANERAHVTFGLIRSEPKAADVSPRVRWVAAGIAAGVLFVLCVVGAWRLGMRAGSRLSDQTPQRQPGAIEVASTPLSPAPAEPAAAPVVPPGPTEAPPAPEPVPAPEPAAAPVMPEVKEGTRAGETTAVDLGGGEKLDLVWIAPGSFLMGSPKGEVDRSDDETQHGVTLTQGFWLGKYEVTQAQWESVMGSNPSKFKGDKRLPVEQVSWEDCQEYIRKLNGSGEGGFRLPTEAEWEYACRAGSTGAYGFGNDAGELGRYVWYGDNSGLTTHPVGRKKPNTWGLYDMHGNVWEWCQDWFGDYPSGSVTDPKGPSSGQSRVLRGGSWGSNPRGCRLAFRSGFVAAYRFSIVGFRLCRSSGSC